MKKIVYLALIITGAVLIIYGFGASDSIGSSFSRLFTGNPTDRTIWLLVGGIITAGIGIAGLTRASKIT
jgi:hypothetical protein